MLLLEMLLQPTNIKSCQHCPGIHPVDMMDLLLVSINLDIQQKLEEFTQLLVYLSQILSRQQLKLRHHAEMTQFTGL